MSLNKVSLPYKIFLVLIAVLGLTACKKVHQPALQSDSDRMLQVELRMPEPWKKIVIGPAHSIEKLTKEVFIELETET